MALNVSTKRIGCSFNGFGARLDFGRLDAHLGLLELLLDFAALSTRSERA